MITDSVSAEINLHYELHVPEGAANSPLLIAIHGYAAHSRYMMREARLVAPDDFVIASLQGPNKFWRPASNSEYKLAFGWLNDFKPEESIALHHEFVLKVIDKVAAQGIVDPTRVYLFGFSQACALNFRFAFTNPYVLRGIVGVCGGIPGDFDTSELYRPTAADVFYLYGDDDEFYPLEKLEGFDDKLSDYLPSYSSKKYEAKHVITDDMRSDILNWLSAESFSTAG